MDYKKLYEQTHRSLSKLSESRQRFNEVLEEANNDLLKSQMNEHPDINKLLTTPAKDLNILYKNLVGDAYFYNHQDETLLDMIEQSRIHHFDSYFSMCNGKINGFVAYKVSGMYIDEIKMFSFDINHSLPLIHDLDNLLEDLKRKYIFIHWSALEANEIGNKIYLKAIKRHKGISFKKKSNDPEGVIEYFIPGTMPIIDAFRDMAEVDFTED